MPPIDLQQYIALLEANRELRRICVAVDPQQEIAVVTDRICKQPGGGQGLLFEQPIGSCFPVATNLFGSSRRICLALGVDHLERITERFFALLEQIEQPLFETLDQQIAGLADFACFAPTCSALPGDDHLLMDPPDLTKLPFLQTWPGDGSFAGYPRYITLPQVFSADPAGAVNCGMYRAQVRGADQLAIRCGTGSGAAAHLEAYRRIGARMPLAIALGGAPAMTFSAMLPLPGVLDEITFAGWLAGSAVEMTSCFTIGLQVPARAEFVIEGYLDPFETVEEGPFGNHTGFYTPAGTAALMRVTAISHRRDAVLPATVVGPPPMEDCWMGKLWERILVAFLRRLVPGITDVCLPLEWIFQQSAIISLARPTSAMVRETADRLWQMGWFSNARLLVFVDGSVDLTSASAVAWRFINETNLAADCFFDSSGVRMAIDATATDPERQRIAWSDDLNALVSRRWHEYGL